MINIKLGVAYDGRKYLGWQKTRMGPSIEERMQKTIERMVQHPIYLQAASRTDAGVHASEQIVNFLTTKEDLNLSQFMIGLNRLLPTDITILSASTMHLSFHPTLDATGKEYRYYICTGPVQLPYHRYYSWHVYHPLDIDEMQKAMPLLVGTHNFMAFCNVKNSAQYTDYNRTIEKLEFIELERGRLCFRLCGNHFLYRMARNIVGTLVDVGKGRIPLQEIPKILERGKRHAAGLSAPAHGLFLHRVNYGPEERSSR